jgi:hypothetical protein
MPKRREYGEDEPQAYRWRRLVMEDVLSTLIALFDPKVLTKEWTIRWKTAKDVNKEDEIKIEATYGTKMTHYQVIYKVCPVWTKDLDYLQKFLLRVVAHQGNPNPSFFLASPNLGDEIPFKGGSL